MIQLMEAIFCEAFYCQYRNGELAKRRHPLPRGEQWLLEATQVLGNMVKATTHREIEIIED